MTGGPLGDLGGDTAGQLVVDTRGLLCPVPVIELARRIRDIPVGSSVRILSDDAAAAYDLPAWCTLRGQEFVGEPAPGEFVVRRTH